MSSSLVLLQLHAIERYRAYKSALLEWWSGVQHKGAAGVGAVVMFVFLLSILSSDRSGSNPLPGRVGVGLRHQQEQVQLHADPQVQLFAPVALHATVPFQSDWSDVAFVSQCYACTGRPLRPVIECLDNLQLWSAHMRHTVRGARLVVVVSRDAWRMYRAQYTDKAAGGHPDICATADDRPTGVVPSIPLTASLIGPCPLQIDAVLWIESVTQHLLPPYTLLQKAGDAKMRWQNDGCAQQWRTKQAAIMALQNNLGFRAVLYMDWFVKVCPDSQQFEALQARVWELKRGNSDSMALRAPYPHSAGILPYLTLDSFERNSNFLGFGTHVSSRELVREWMAIFDHQMHLAGSTQTISIVHDQPSLRESFHNYYSMPEHAGHEQLVEVTEFCRYNGQCSESHSCSVLYDAHSHFARVRAPAQFVDAIQPEVQQAVQPQEPIVEEPKVSAPTAAIPESVPAPPQDPPKPGEADEKTTESGATTGTPAADAASAASPSSPPASSDGGSAPSGGSAASGASDSDSSASSPPVFAQAVAAPLPKLNAKQVARALTILRKKELAAQLLAAKKKDEANAKQVEPQSVKSSNQKPAPPKPVYKSKPAPQKPAALNKSGAQEAKAAASKQLALKKLEAERAQRAEFERQKSAVAESTAAARKAGLPADDAQKPNQVQASNAAAVALKAARARMAAAKSAPPPPRPPVVGPPAVPESKPPAPGAKDPFDADGNRIGSSADESEEEEVAVISAPTAAAAAAEVAADEAETAIVTEAEILAASDASGESLSEEDEAKLLAEAIQAEKDLKAIAAEGGAEAVAEAAADVSPAAAASASEDDPAPDR